MRAERGMTLIDVVVGSAILLIVFLGFFGAFQLSIELVFSTKAKTGAVALMTDRIEYIRSLPYASVGTVGGIPQGNVPQLTQTNLNGILYTTRTLIQYVDAPEDGTDENDENGITADYKSVKVEVLWMVKGMSRSVSATTILSPLGEETLEGGGVLRVSVFDAAALPVSGALVRIVNDTSAPPIDVSVYTNSEGRVSFPGALAGSDYQIRVSKEGFSSAETYEATVENPNPSPAPVSVVEGMTTSVGFAIDRLSVLSLATFNPIGPGEFSDSFLTYQFTQATSSVSLSAGAVILDELSGEYVPLGSILSTPLAPAYLVEWDEVSFEKNTPPDTALRVRVYVIENGVPVPIPDEVLPGNAEGFVNSFSLSAVSPATYGSIQLGAELSTENPEETPALLSWSVSYRAGPTPLGGVPLSVRGTKTIGTDSGGQPIYLMEEEITTTQFGEWSFEDIEWDLYSVEVSDSAPLMVVERCPHTVSLLPGTTLPVSLFVSEKTPHSVRVAVSSGESPLSGATVSLIGVSTRTNETSLCGQSFFGGVASGSYTLRVEKSGFQTYMESIEVSGHKVFSVQLSPL